MKPQKLLWPLMIFFFIFTTCMSYAKDFVIYSIVKNISMGYEDEVEEKNFYVNIGKNQGVEKGDILDVFRTISRLDPFASKKRFNYSFKIGSLEVLHSEENSAITMLKELNARKKKTPLFEIENFIIGDNVEVQLQ